MNDEILSHLRMAHAAMLGEAERAPSRELSVAMTNTDTAILWRQHDIQIKTPPINEAKS